MLPEDAVDTNQQPPATIHEESILDSLDIDDEDVDDLILISNISVGGLVLVLIVIILSVVCCKCKKRGKKGKLQAMRNLKRQQELIADMI